jgi:UDP-N-acetylglucosamine 1-carboxyvinyltransferase
LCALLSEMGAQITGVGTSTLRIEGVDSSSLHPVSHRVVSDRVQAATYIAAVGICGGEIFIEDAHAEHMEMLIDRFVEMGMIITPSDHGILAIAPNERLRCADVSTLPYPGVATVYMPLVVTMLAVADGVGIVTENLYPGRFRYVDELRRLGASIRTDGHHAVVSGVTHLTGAPVRAVDIRAGAALVVAGLVADGETTISDIYHIDRGYEDLVGRLRSLGASIERVTIG